MIKCKKTFCHKILNNLKIISILVLTVSLVVSCGNSNEKNDSRYLSGTIKNFNKNKIVLRDFLNSDYKVEMPVSSEGVFSDTLPENTSNYYSLLFGKKVIDIYLPKARNLNIWVDANNLDSVLFKGENANENYYLAKKAKIGPQSYEEMVKFYSLPENEFLSEIKKLETESMELINNSNLCEPFLKQELRNLHYEYLIGLMDYEGVYANLTGNTSFKVSNSFPSVEEEKFEYGNITDFNNSGPHRSLLFKYYRKLKKENIIKAGKYDDFSTFVNAKIDNQDIKNRLLYSYLKAVLTSIPDKERVYSSFMELSTDDSQKKEIEKIYNEMTLLNKGNMSPKFSNYRNAKGGTSSFDDYKGKYVYIDVWATWCGPCKAEIPFLKDIAEKYKGKNITFVSISVDKERDFSKWEKMVEEKQLSWPQLFADNSFNSEFIKAYKIKTIPHFILLDPEGKIVLSSAHRPSDAKLIEVFNELGIN